MRYVVYVHSRFPYQFPASPATLGEAVALAKRIAQDLRACTLLYQEATNGTGRFHVETFHGEYV